MFEIEFLIEIILLFEQHLIKSKVIVNYQFEL